MRPEDHAPSRRFVFLSGLASTTPAHQWLVHEPGPLVSGWKDSQAEKTQHGSGSTL
jgi:hypothetical protein